MKSSVHTLPCGCGVVGIVADVGVACKLFSSSKFKFCTYVHTYMCVHVHLLFLAIVYFPFGSHIYFFTFLSVTL